MIERAPPVEIEASFRWWLFPYLYTLAFFCVIFGALPDPEKFERVVKRGTKLRVIK